MNTEDPSSSSRPSENSGGSPPDASPPDISTKAIQSLLALLIVLFLIVAISSFLPDKRLWGVNHLSFYPLPVRIMLLVFMAGAFVPKVSRFLYALIEKEISLLTNRSQRGIGPLFGISIAAFILFLAFSASTPLLGDGQYVTTNLTIATKNEARSPLTIIGNIITKEHIAPGTTILYFLVSKAGKTLLGVEPAAAVRLINALLGGLFILILLGFARREMVSPPLKALFILLAVFSGATQLFFGYIENYTPLLFVGTLYVISCFRFLNHRESIVTPAVLLSLAIFLNVLGVLLAASFAFLLASKVALRKGPGTLKYLATLIAAATGFAAFAGSQVDKLSKYYMPISGSPEAVGVFSPVHLVDILNEILLVLPALPVFLALPLLASRTARTSGSPDGGNARSASRAEPTGRTRRSRGKRYPWSGKRDVNILTLESHLAFSIALPCAIFLFFFQPALGMARDWDLFAFASFGFLPWVLVSLKRRFERAAIFQKEGTAWGLESLSVINPDKEIVKKSAGGGGDLPTPRDFALVAFPAIALCAVLSVSWVGINASSRRATARFEKLLAFDRANAAYGYENLSIYHRKERNFLEAIYALEKATEISPNPRYYNNLGTLYLVAGDSLRAIEHYQRCLQLSSSYKKARKNLAILLNSTGRFEELIPVCQEGIAEDPSGHFYYFFLGKSYLYTGNVKEGTRLLVFCKSLNPPEDVVRSIDMLLSRVHPKK